MLRHAFPLSYVQAVTTRALRPQSSQAVKHFHYFPSKPQQEGRSGRHDYTSHISHARPSTIPPRPSPGSHLKHISTPASFEQTWSNLCSSLNLKHIDTSCSIWNGLSASDLVWFRGPRHYAELAGLIARNVPPPNQISHYSSASLKALEDMAQFAASGGFTQGLRAIMISYIKLEDTAGVQRLYDQYIATVEKKDIWEGSVEQESARSDSQDSSLVEPEDPFTHAPAFSVTYSSSSEGIVHPDILLLGIAACAIRSDFHHAVHLAIWANQRNGRLNGSRLRAILGTLGSDTPHLPRIESYARQIMTTMLLMHPPAFTKHLFNLAEDKSCKSVELMYSHVMTGLSGTGRWLTLDSATLSLQTPVVVPSEVWPAFLTSFMRCRRLDLAEKLWEDMQKLGIAQDAVLWSALLDGYAHLRMADRAISTWEFMCQQGVFPDTKAHRAIIHVLMRCGRWQEALHRVEAFQEAVNNGEYSLHDPGVRMVFNEVINSLLLDRRESEALAIFEQMESTGPKPDIITVNSVMKYFRKQADLKGIASMLQKIEALDLAADSYTYSIVLTALLPVHSNAMKIVFDFMAKKGDEPNVAIYTSIIDHLMDECTPAAFQAAVQILDTMETGKSDDVRPNVVTYTSFLCGVQRQTWLEQTRVREFMDRIASKMEQRRIMFSVVGYNILITACLENPGPEGVQNALHYYREMGRRRLLVTSDTWHILLFGVARRQDWGTANMLIDEMRKSKYKPSGAILNLVDKIRRQVDFSPRRARKSHTLI